MLEQYEAYLGVLPLTKSVKDKIEETIVLNKKIVAAKILDIFICDIKNLDGTKTYTSLWLFTDTLAIECKNFLTKHDFDMAQYHKSIRYCSIEPIEFDLDTPTNLSSVKVSWTFNSSVTGTLTATEDNCIKAFEIYKKYIVANIGRT